MSDGLWRVGTHYAIHVYSGDVPIATFHTAADARAAVEAYNNTIGPPPYGPGALCQTCGHFAARHDGQGCHGVDRAKGCRFGNKQGDPCPVMRWNNRDWPDPRVTC